MDNFETDLLRSSYAFDLPPEQIAQQALSERDQCRLMLVRRDESWVEHRRFYELANLLVPGSVLILNDSKVLPVRVPVYRSSGGKGELLLIRGDGDKVVGMGRPSKRMKEGEVLRAKADSGVEFTLSRYLGEGWWEAVMSPMLWPDRLESVGELPLPPYIHRENGPSVRDAEDYQCVYAGPPGSTAAPTAGLHFTKDLLAKLEEKGVLVCKCTLHVGPGTFLPVKADRLKDHVMHEEFYRIPTEVSQAVCRAKSQGNPVIAVGTTVVRALESSADKVLAGEEDSGATRLFLHPPKKLRVVDQLITNFHLPESTLLMLVATLTGREKLLNYYRTAVEEKYRFFSYGDAMMII